MKIDSSFVNYWFDTITIELGAVSCLCSKYQLSQIEGFSLYHYLLARETISRDEMNQLVKEWRATVSEPSYDDCFGVKDSNKLEMLLPILGIEEKYTENLEAKKTLSALSHNQAAGTGSLIVVIKDIVCFVRALKAWKELKIQRYVSRINHPILHQYRKSINAYARFLSGLEWMQGPLEEGTNSVLEKILARALIKLPTGFNELIRLFYLNGYNFDETSNKECTSAVLWLTAIRDFCIGDGWNAVVLDIFDVISERNLTTNDPYLGIFCGVLSHIDATNYLKNISDEYEVNTAEAPVPREPKPKAGVRGKGTWHTERNEVADAIWNAIFAKIWNGYLKKQIEKYYFRDRSPEKVKNAIVLLGAAHFYMALEKEGFAKEYGTSGTKLSFFETVKSVIDIRRQSLDDYMLLMHLIGRINDTIKQESFNNRHENNGYEKVDNPCDDAESKPSGKRRIVNGDASQSWALDLALFRSEHPSMYSLLGEDIILSADFSIDKELEEYKNNNIKKMMKTNSDLCGKISQEYQNITQGRKN